jgi:hypothetical protein
MARWGTEMNHRFAGQGSDVGTQHRELRPDMRRAQSRFLFALAVDPDPADGETMAPRLRELGDAALWLGWTWRQGYEAGIRRPLPVLTAEDLPRELRPGTGRVHPRASWQRFDITWRRLQARLADGSVALAVLALADFGRACRVIADQVDTE